MLRSIVLNLLQFFFSFGGKRKLGRCWLWSLGQQNQDEESQRIFTEHIDIGMYGNIKKIGIDVDGSDRMLTNVQYTTHSGRRHQLRRDLQRFSLSSLIHNQPNESVRVLSLSFSISSYRRMKTASSNKLIDIKFSSIYRPIAHHFTGERQRGDGKE